MAAGINAGESRNRLQFHLQQHIVGDNNGSGIVFVAVRPLQELITVVRNNDKVYYRVCRQIAKIRLFVVFVLQYGSVLGLYECDGVSDNIFVQDVLCSDGEVGRDIVEICVPACKIISDRNDRTQLRRCKQWGTA